VAGIVVENNLLANKYGVELLDETSRALYEKLKAAGIGSVDELQERYKACAGKGDCERGIRNKYRQQEKEAGEKLAALYQRAGWAGRNIKSAEMLKAG
jgi:filamentous hemagglutinin